MSGTEKAFGTTHWQVECGYCHGLLVWVSSTESWKYENKDSRKEEKLRKNKKTYISTPNRLISSCSVGSLGTGVGALISVDTSVQDPDTECAALFSLGEINYKPLSSRYSLYRHQFRASTLVIRKFLPSALVNLGLSATICTASAFVPASVETVLPASTNVPSTTTTTMRRPTRSTTATATLVLG
eukprot:2852208-Rhodomonas_salina.3